MNRWSAVDVVWVLTVATLCLVTLILTIGTVLRA